MRPSRRSRSRIRTALWLVSGPFMAVGGLLLFVFGFAVLAVAAQLVAAALRHARV